jgi:hypothetical protein
MDRDSHALLNGFGLVPALVFALLALWVVVGVLRVAL